MRIPPLVRVIVLFSAVVALGIVGFLYFNRQGDDGRRLEPLEIASVSTNSGAEQTGITVDGIGEVRIEPDTAFLSLGIEQLGKTAVEATAALSVGTNSVLESIRAIGVDALDIVTESLVLAPIYAERKSGASGDSQAAVEGYRASTTVLVTVREMDKASEVLDAALLAGANIVNSVSFGVAEAAELRQQALDSATRDAAQKAKAMALALGGRVGGLIWIVEESSGYPEPFPPMRRAAALESQRLSQSRLPVESGWLTIAVRVRANFAYE